MNNICYTHEVYRDYYKIKKIIKSCDEFGHFKSTENILKNFEYLNQYRFENALIKNWWKPWECYKLKKLIDLVETELRQLFSSSIKMYNEGIMKNNDYLNKTITGFSLP